MNNSEMWQSVIERIPSVPVPEIIASEPLVGGKFLELSKHTIKYPNGEIRPYEGCSRKTIKGVVSILAKTNENVLILIAEYRPLISPYWNISLPAGLVDAGYTREEACKKELLEETGYVWNRVQFLISTAPSSGKSNEIISQYFMNNVVPGPEWQKLEPTEIIEILRVPISELDILMKTVMNLTSRFVVDAKIDQSVSFARRKGFL